jgi:thiamine-monophosphate kinase
LIAGVIDEAARHACPLVGGNLSRAASCSLTFTVVGGVPRGRALRRGRVRAGDRLFVTGVLGAGALARLRADRSGTELRHLPTPRLAAGRALARLAETSGCLDLSDGLSTDLAHLLEGTGLGARVDAAALPRPRGFDRACRRLGVDPLRLLCAGGEDYELLFALRDRPGSRVGPGAGRPRLESADLAEQLGLPVHEIGAVVARPGLEGLPPGRVAHHF